MFPQVEQGKKTNLNSRRSSELDRKDLLLAGLSIGRASLAATFLEHYWLAEALIVADFHSKERRDAVAIAVLLVPIATQIV